MAYWLIKSEPSAYAWDDLVEEGRDTWDGVRNAQAQNNMKAMELGDKAFFYHSGPGPAVVGVVEIVRAFYPDHTDPTGRSIMVDVAPLQPLPTPVTLKAIKAEPRLHDLALVRQPRLSVMPVPEEAWRLISAMGGLSP